MTETQLFEQLYDVLFEHDKDFIRVTRKTDKMVSELMEDIYEISKDEMEVISGELFDLISEARRDGYEIGIKHAVRLIFGLLFR